MHDRSPELSDQNSLLQELKETLQRLEKLEQDNRSLRAQLVAQRTESDAAAFSTAEKVQEGIASTASETANKLEAATSRIKELKQTRNSLRASEGWLRAILDSATDYAIITLDLNGHVTSWNSGAHNVLGWEPEDAVGRNAAFFFTPEDREEGVPQQEMRLALSQGRAEDERWHLKKDGSRFWASGVMLPFRDGDLLGYLKILRDQTQQRREQEALRRSELIVGKMTEGVSLSTADGIIVYTNPAEDRLFGYDPGELIGQHVSIQNAYPPDENEQIVSAVIEQLNTQGRWEGEWHNRRKDGTTFISASRITAVEVDGISHWLCVQRDVTEEKRAEAALRESEERARISQQAGGIGSFELFPSTGRIITSEQFCRLWGVPVQCEFDVTDLIACIHPDDQPRVTTGHRALSDDALGYIEYRLTRPDTGETRWIARRAQRVQDQGGVPRYLGVIYDITSRKRGEEQIKFQAQLLDSVREAVIATDLYGQVTYWNRFAETLYGWSAQEAVGRSVLELTSGSDPTKAGEVMAALAQGGTWSGEFTGRRRDGSTFPGHVTDAPVHDESGSFIGIVGISYDISAEKQAVEHQRLLINELNHRVKNTLATVQSIASQTLRNAPSGEAAREAIESRLIGLSRAHNVLTRENWEGAYLREIVIQAVEPYQGHSDGRFEVRGVDVRLAPRIALALAMALQELVTNAVKYGALSNETGRVTIAWELKGRGDEPRLEMRWEEAGGPPVQVPSRRGFGTKLIERSLSQELNGKVNIKFEPSGVVCTIVAPLAG